MFRATLAFFLAALSWAAANHTDFQGTWIFDPGHSKNIGMMSQMQMTSAIEQDPGTLTQHVDATVMGQNVKQTLRFDLDGKGVSNDTPMGEASQTVSKWDGAKLVTTWVTPGAIAGTNNTSVETRYLSADGMTMYVESSRANKPLVVLAYRKK